MWITQTKLYRHSSSKSRTEISRAERCTIVGQCWSDSSTADIPHTRSYTSWLAWKLAWTVRWRPSSDCVTISSSLSPHTASSAAPKLHRSVYPLKFYPSLSRTEHKAKRSRIRLPNALVRAMANEDLWSDPKQAQKRLYLWAKHVILFYCPKMVKNAVKATAKKFFFQILWRFVRDQSRGNSKTTDCIDWQTGLIAKAEK